MNIFEDLVFGNLKTSWEKIGDVILMDFRNKERDFIKTKKIEKEWKIKNVLLAYVIKV